MKWAEVRLTDICNPKQWSNLPMSEFTIEGFPVYGANGIIGYYSEYNHVHPTLAITCRGATSGAINITTPYSYINSNAMALDDLSPNIDIHFLYFALRKRGFKDVISGSAQPQITIKGLESVFVKIPELLSDQIKIATLLKKTENLIQKRKESIALLDELVKSTFLELFGDPHTNQNGYKKVKISELTREVNYGTSAKGLDAGRLPYLRMNNITYEGNWDLSSLKYVELSDIEIQKYVLKPNDLVFNRTNSKELVGKTAVCDFEEKMVIAGYLIRVRLKKNCNPWYLWGYLNSSHGKSTLYNMAKSIVGMANINAQEFQRIHVLLPPISDQNKFEKIVRGVNQLRKKLNKSLEELMSLQGSLSQRAFNGELDLSKVNIDHLLPKEELINIKPDTIPPSENKTPKKKFETPEEQRLFFEEAKSEVYGFSDGLAKSFGAGKKGQQKLRGKLDAFFTSAQISHIIQEHFQGVHFTAEMLMHFLQETKLATVQYTGAIERRENPKIDLVRDIPQVLEKILHITDPDLLQDKRVPKLEQVFYNGKNPEFELCIRDEDLEFVQDKTPEQLSGIYFKIKA